MKLLGNLDGLPAALEGTAAEVVDQLLQCYPVRKIGYCIAGVDAGGEPTMVVIARELKSDAEEMVTAWLLTQPIEVPYQTLRTLLAGWEEYNGRSIDHEPLKYQDLFWFSEFVARRYGNLDRIEKAAAERFGPKEAGLYEVAVRALFIPRVKEVFAAELAVLGIDPDEPELSQRLAIARAQTEYHLQPLQHPPEAAGKFGVVLPQPWLAPPVWR